MVGFSEEGFNAGYDTARKATNYNECKAYFRDKYNKSGNDFFNADGASDIGSMTVSFANGLIGAMHSDDLSMPILQYPASMVGGVAGAWDALNKGDYASPDNLKRYNTYLKSEGKDVPRNDPYEVCAGLAAAMLKLK